MHPIIISLSAILALLHSGGHLHQQPVPQSSPITISQFIPAYQETVIMTDGVAVSSAIFNRGTATTSEFAFLFNVPRLTQIQISYQGSDDNILFNAPVTALLFTFNGTGFGYATVKFPTLPDKFFRLTALSTGGGGTMEFTMLYPYLQH